MLDLHPYLRLHLHLGLCNQIYTSINKTSAIFTDTFRNASLRQKEVILGMDSTESMVLGACLLLVGKVVWARHGVQWSSVMRLIVWFNAQFSHKVVPAHEAGCLV